MASFVQRALMYLGLKDIDDEDDYDSDEEEVSETAANRVRQSSYPNLRRRGRASPRCARSPATTGANRRRRWLAPLSCGRS